MLRWRILLSFAMLFLCVFEICSSKEVEVVASDPTDFDSAVAGYEAWVDSKPYAKFIEKTRDWVCLYHFLVLMTPACMAPQGGNLDPKLCCGAIKAFVQEDQGKCLCQDRVALNPAVFPFTLGVVKETKCDITFPIPEVSDPMMLPRAIAASPVCEGVPRTAGFTINPKFFEGAANTDPEELPSFRELFTPPPSGPFPTSYTAVNVTRPTESILVNNFSTPTTFQALVFYPSDKNLEENIDPETGAVGSPVLANVGGKFPIVEFSPGFTGPPQIFILMMSHLASFGMVVISQESTSQLRGSNDRAFSEAWADDMAFGLLYLKNEGYNSRSFLHNRVDSTRAGIGGHSFGGAMSFPAARRAVDLGIGVQAVVSLQPSCVPFAGICDLAGDAGLDKLQGVDYLVVSGSADLSALPSHAEYFASLVQPTVTPKNLRGVNHCLVELDPKFWLLGGDCGIGQISPMEQAKQVQELTGEFFKDKLVDS
ncbi:hypothetical protein BSKO_12013 [Bryopsis sp. KO-2023]|nr:hypothetical protein BSKO_12013 [Bryopsis sp. KO-2023]